MFNYLCTGIVSEHSVFILIGVKSLVDNDGLE